MYGASSGECCQLLETEAINVPSQAPCVHYAGLQLVVTIQGSAIQQGELVTQPQKKMLRTVKGTREYTYLGCPLTRNRSAWCFRICVPDGEGQGHCGRVAPHGLKGRTQLAIERHGRKQRIARLKQLEESYLASPYNQYHDPGIRVSEGEADIVIPLQDTLVNASGRCPTSVCIKAMNDSAVFAVSSLVSEGVIQTVNFNASLTRATPTGELLARGRFVGMSGTHYLAESIVTDSDGSEIGRGDGVFVLEGDCKPED